MAGAGLLERSTEQRAIHGDIVLRTVDGTIVVYDEIAGGRGRIEVRARWHAGDEDVTPRRRRFRRAAA